MLKKKNSVVQALLNKNKVDDGKSDSIASNKVLANYTRKSAKYSLARTDSYF